VQLALPPMMRARLPTNIIVRTVCGDGCTPERGEPFFTIVVDRRSSSRFPPGIYKSQRHLDGARHPRPTDVVLERAYIDLRSHDAIVSRFADDGPDVDGIDGTPRSDKLNRLRADHSVGRTRERHAPEGGISRAASGVKNPRHSNDESRALVGRRFSEGLRSRRHRRDYRRAKKRGTGADNPCVDRVL
jgi:hypothetical protein